ncbi:hypothetical protein REPUB_Repub09cG0044100 [Reevesia pubescens]
MEGSKSVSKPVTHKTFWETKNESEKEQLSHGDCLSEGFVSVLPEAVLLEWRQNDLADLIKVWDQWGSEKHAAFRKKYGDIALLLPVKVDRELIEAMVQFWDPSHRCFILNGNDLVPTIEEYSALVRAPSTIPNKIYWKEQKKPKYRKRIGKILGTEYEEIKCSTKGESFGIPWKTLKPYVVESNHEEYSMEMFALAIYGLVIFPKVLGHVEMAVVDFFGQMDGKKINHVPSILAETIRTLNFCRRKGKGRLITCTLLLYIWIQSHFWGKPKIPIFPYTCIPIREFCKKKWSKGITKEQWVASFQSLDSADITWKAPWMTTSSFVYKCGENPWVPLTGLWGIVSYASLLVRRQFGSQQFIPMTHGLDTLEFEYKGEGYSVKLHKVIESWKEIHESAPGTFSNKTTPEYLEWKSKRVCDALIHLQEFTQPLDFLPRVVLSDAELVRQELEAKKTEWEREKTKLVEEATFAKYDTMIKAAELERTARELEITRGDLENSKGVIKSLETEVGYEASGIKTSQEWRAELVQMEKRKNAWQEDSQKKKEKMDQTSQSLRQSETKRRAVEAELRTCKRNNTTLEKQLQSEKKARQEEVASLIKERDMWRNTYGKVSADLVRCEEDIRILKTFLHTKELWRSFQEVKRIVQIQHNKMMEMIERHGTEKKALEHWIALTETSVFGRYLYINHLATQLCKAVGKARELMDQAKTLQQQLMPTSSHGQRLLHFLDDIIDVCRQVSYFYGFNSRMIEDVPKVE